MRGEGGSVRSGRLDGVHHQYFCGIFYRHQLRSYRCGSSFLWRKAGGESVRDRAHFSDDLALRRGGVRGCRHPLFAPYAAAPEDAGKSFRSVFRIYAHLFCGDACQSVLHHGSRDSAGGGGFETPAVLSDRELRGQYSAGFSVCGRSSDGRSGSRLSHRYWTGPQRSAGLRLSDERAVRPPFPPRSNAPGPGNALPGLPPGPPRRTWRSYRPRICWAWAARPG